MDFAFTKEEEEVRAEVRRFLKENPPQNFKILDEEVGFGFGAWSDEFNQLLGERGWLSRSWPKKYGGQGRPLMEQMVFVEEMAYQRAPMVAGFIGMAISHAIMDYGNPDLQAEILPKIADGTFTGWMGLSEPDAGTDLTAVKTVAIRDGDHYIINGQKIWSAHAHLAKYCYLLARTNQNAEPHRGLSMFILPKSLPGVEVRGLTTLAHTHLHNEIFLDNVRIHKKYLVGEENRGFHLLLSGLDGERFWSRVQRSPWLRRLLEDLIEYAKNTKRDGRLLADDLVIRRKFAEVAVEIEACRLWNYELIWKMENNMDLGVGVTAMKLYTDEMSQRFMNFAMDLLGPFGQLEPGSKWSPLKGMVERWYLITSGFSIAAGTSEILRDNIAYRGLGLPRLKV